jgi:hypothetical protein
MSACRQTLALAGLCVCLPLLALARDSVPASEQTAAPEAEVPLRRALLVGSSSVNDWFGQVITQDLRKRGFEVERRGFSAAGFSRPDFRDMLQTVEALPIDADTALVLVYLGMNDAQALWLRPEERESGAEWIKWGEPGWEEIYQRRAQAYLAALCERGAQRTVVLLPVDVTRPSMQRRLERIRAAQARAASLTSCATAVPTTGDVGRFRVDGKATRAKDGIHMSRQGAQVLWKRVRAPVLEQVEPPPPTRPAAAR